MVARRPRRRGGNSDRFSGGTNEQQMLASQWRRAGRHSDAKCARTHARIGRITSYRGRGNCHRTAPAPLIERGGRSKRSLRERRLAGERQCKDGDENDERPRACTWVASPPKAPPSSPSPPLLYKLTPLPHRSKLPSPALLYKLTPPSTWLQTCRNQQDTPLTACDPLSFLRL
jgi:hypothetical protein